MSTTTTANTLQPSRGSQIDRHVRPNLHGIPRSRINRQPRHHACFLAPAQVARGTDSAGRFVGPRDIERAVAHFWHAPHRRGAAPLVYVDPVFGRVSTGVARPRASKSGLGPIELRAIWAGRASGLTHAALAATYGVSVATINYHVRVGGSVAMRHALATARPAPVSAAA
jgi:hypothetical protein